MLRAAECLFPGTVLPRLLDGWRCYSVSPSSFPFADFIALVITLIWILAVSVMLCRTTEHTSSQTSQCQSA